MKIKLSIRAEFWNKKPKIDIYIDNIIKDSFVFNTHDTVSFIYEDDLKDGPHTLRVVYNNKTNRDTILDDNKNIIKDVLIFIESLEFEDIDVNYLLTVNSEYIPNYPEPYYSQQKLKPAKTIQSTTLGWNGIWNFPFTTPVFDWFVENL